MMFCQYKRFSITYFDVFISSVVILSDYWGLALGPLYEA